MKVIVLYFMVLQNSLQIVLLETTQTTDNVTHENARSTTIEETNDVTHKDYNSLSEGNTSQPEERDENNGLDYPMKTLMRLFKVKGSISDSFDDVSKIFGRMQDVGSELFGVIKDGALDVKKYLPFK